MTDMRDAYMKRDLRRELEGGTKPTSFRVVEVTVKDSRMGYVKPVYGPVVEDSRFYLTAELSGGSSIDRESATIRFPGIEDKSQ